MDQERLSLLALHFIPGIGNYLIRQLVSYCGSAENTFKMPKGKLLKIPGIGEVTADIIRKGAPIQDAEDELVKAEKCQTQLLFYMDKKYPSRLKTIPDAPSLIYVKGDVHLENPRSVGIVGTRNATDYGKHCTEELIDGLVKHGALIVSGLAYGIDIHAHKQALKKGLPTVGIMGSGMDIIYPSTHKDTAHRMIENHGGLITENRLGTKPDPHLFPERNRIIAGLSDALVVVEAGDKGGALITADIANSYNRDVFAFPGNIGQHYSIGCNALIKNNKAHLLTSIADLEYIMNWDCDKPTVETPPLKLPGLNDGEINIINVLAENKGSLPIDVLSWKCTMPLGPLASTLLNLEFKGLIQSLPGKIYRLTKKIEGKPL